MLKLTDIQPQQNEVYLDNNATTPVLPQAAEAAIHTMNLCYGNPSSSHMTGIRAKYILDTTRSLARQVTGATNGEIIFTSGATEGIQTSIISALNASRDNNHNIAKPVLLYGATEHKAVPETLKHWNQMLNIGAEVVAIPVDSNGILDQQFIAEHAANALMVCTMIANNETGVFQDIKALEDVIRSNNPDVLWMVDCVQGLGKIDLELSKTTIDYAPFSGHKLYGPKGIGVLYVRESAPYTPFIAGGGQESGLRSGTENLPGIASLNAIFRLLADENDDTFKSHETLLAYRTQLADVLNEVFPGIVYNHDFDCSLPTTLNFSVKGLSGKDIMNLFDAAKIRVSGGSACSSKVAGSFVLDAMGKSKWQSEGAIRMSFGPASTQQEIDNACEAIRNAVSAMQNSCLILSDANDSFDSTANGLQQWIYDAQCTWCYIDKAAKEVILIDPVPELVSKFDTLVSCQNYKVKAVLSTHKHAEQVDAPAIIRELLGDKMSADEFDQLGWSNSAKTEVELANGDKASALSIGEKMLVKVATPGHTDNSVTYILGTVENGKLASEAIDYVFSGDAIQIGGIGRSDFAVSDSDALYDSIQKLAAITNSQSLICPAHDYKQLFTTTLSIESLNNSLLAAVIKGDISKAEFSAEKADMDKQIEHSADTQLCGNIKESIDPSIDVTPDKLVSFLVEHDDVVVLDVRESHEYEANRQEYLADQKLVNIPLSQITEFVHDHSNDKTDASYVCICRSGARSDAAAKTLKRMGFENVYHVPGGFALVS
ncbi:aminotransferase class V-fold PLP-dependent enzyme [Thalassotalea crassostreae]|uniref:aminotransferase class V-fold PLP-dependent enzyme n=1 Tax=Thalassotalea crassostreae TaxID=1763536 RepID=UPI000839665C|nr:aminotransferase class V-fold PLP-dependent enzyme [Thalassotalea crassostreae]